MTFNVLNIFSPKIRYASRSPKWSAVRKKHLLINNCCAACGSQKNLEVHHIIPVHLDSSLELEPDNLITLCSKSCHLLFGHLMDYKSWNTNVTDDCKEISKRISNRPYK